MLLFHRMLPPSWPALDPAVEVYFKEGQRWVTRYRMDRLLETLMLVNGEESAREWLLLA